MKCYECGQLIQNESQKTMEKVRIFRWNDTLVPFHKECWQKTRVSEAKRYHAKTFVESLAVFAVALIATYMII